MAFARPNDAPPNAPDQLALRDTGAFTVPAVAENSKIRGNKESQRPATEKDTGGVTSATQNIQNIVDGNSSTLAPTESGGMLALDASQSPAAQGDVLMLTGGPLELDEAKEERRTGRERRRKEREDRRQQKEERTKKKKERRAQEEAEQHAELAELGQEGGHKQKRKRSPSDVQAQAHPASTGDLKDKSEKPAKKKRKTKRKKAGDDLVQPHTQEDAEAGQEAQKRKHHDVDTAGSTNITSNTSSELLSNPANFNVAKKRKLGPGGVSNSDVVEKPSASAATLDPVTSEGHATDGYGEPVHLPAPQKGLYSTRYYPHRTVPFQFPTGELTAKAKAERYKGLTDAQMHERKAEYGNRSREHPKLFQEAFKHTARGRLDCDVHLWLVPRIYNYYYTPREGRTEFLDRIVRDLVEEFPDLHPEFHKFRDSSMEKEYLTGLRNTVCVATSGVKAALENPAKVDNIDKDVVKHLTGTAAPSRAHDLWAKTVLARTGDRKETEGLELSDTNGESPLTLQEEWDAEFAEAVRVHGKKKAAQSRLKLEQEFRKKKFDKLPDVEKKVWEDLAATEVERPVDPMTALTTGLPFLNVVLKRFSHLSKSTVVLLLGAPDYANPGKILVYHNTYCPGSSGVPDFFNGPSRFGENTLIPAFRGFLAQSYGASQENVAKVGSSLPMPPEEPQEPMAVEKDDAAMHDDASPFSGLTSRSGIQFVVTPPPKDWAVDCRELDAARKAVKAFLCDTFKAAHQRLRCHFSTLGSRPSEYIDLSMLPTTKVIPVRHEDGTTGFEESSYNQIVYPTDPLSMPWYSVKAYYDLFKDPNSRFAWRAEELRGATSLKEPPESIQATLQGPQSTNVTAQSDTKKSKKKGSSTAKPAQPSLVPSGSRQAETSRASGKVFPKRTTQAPDSEEEAESSDESERSSAYSVGSESSVGEVYCPETVYVLRSETVSRTGRRSIPPPPPIIVTSAKRHPAISNVGPSACGEVGSGSDLNQPFTATDPALSSKPLNTSRTESLVLSPEKNCNPQGKLGATKGSNRYIVKPPREPELSDLNIDFATMVEHVRELALPKILKVENIPLPNIPVVLKHCARLDNLFHTKKFPLLQLLNAEPSPSDPQGPPVKKALGLFWEILNDPKQPVPTCLAASQLASKSGTSVSALVAEAEEFLFAVVEVLEGHDMVADEEHGHPIFISWTSHLLILARYLQFVESVEPTQRSKGSEDYALVHERILELAVIHLVLRYCAGAVTSHTAYLPAPSLSPSIANAIPTLGAAWVQMVKRLCCPINKLSASEILGPSWPSTVDRATQSVYGNPFFHIATPAKRWFTVTATNSLYDALVKLEVRLHSEPSLLEGMSLYSQFTILASLFALHVEENIRGGDEEWLGVVDKFLEAIKSCRGGGDHYEIEIQPKQPPPTLAPTVRTESEAPARQRLRRREKTAWAVGDIASIGIGGKIQEVIFVYKVTYGAKSKRLVMAHPETLQEFFAADGEAELSLPPFSLSSLVKRGSCDPVELARLHIQGRSVVGHVPFSDMMNPMYAEYLAQLKDLPDDVEPDELEKFGFKPPEFFIRKYLEAQAAKEAPLPQGSGILGPQGSTSFHLASGPASGTDGPASTKIDPPPAPPTHDQTALIAPDQRLPPKDNRLAAPSLDPKSLEEADVRGTRNPMQDSTAAFAATGQDEETAGDGRQGVGKEHREEEEADGVLTSDKKQKSKGGSKLKVKATPNTKPKASSATSAGTSTQAGKAAARNRADHGPPTRASPRKRGSDSVPSMKPGHRMSTRSKEVASASGNAGVAAPKPSRKK